MTTRTPPPLVLTASAAASLAAAACLLVLAFLPRPPFPYSHDDILWGTQKLTGEQLPHYLAYLKANLSFDGVYLLGHILTWLGYSALVADTRPVASAVIAVLGLASGGLDLFENAIRWSVATHLDGGAAGAGVGLVWSVVVKISFWAIYVAAVAVAWAVVGRGRAGRLTGAVGYLAAAAALLLYWRGFFVSFCWLIVWHLVSAVYLWHESRQIGPLPAAPN